MDLEISDGESILRYDPPILVSDDNAPPEAETTTVHEDLSNITGMDCQGDRRKFPRDQPAVDMKQYTADILNEIFPPKEWVKDGKHFRQTISSKPASREEVILLEEKINQILKQNNVRNSGLCPLRYHIMDQCMLEMTRQEAIDCGERGLLLYEVWNHKENRYNAYRRLVDNTIVYGIQKTIQGEEAVSHMEAKISELEKQVEKLQATRSTLEEILEQKRSRARELRQAADAKRAEELDVINKNFGVLEAYMTKLNLKEATQQKKK